MTLEDHKTIKIFHSGKKSSFIDALFLSRPSVKYCQHSVLTGFLKTLTFTFYDLII